MSIGSHKEKALLAAVGNKASRLQCKDSSDKISYPDSFMWREILFPCSRLKVALKLLLALVFRHSPDLKNPLSSPKT